MANILLLDDNEVAGRAMRGLLTRGQHACIVATTADEAWNLLRESVVIDLVFLELKLPNNAGMLFLQRVRDDCFWQKLPIVVYTTAADAIMVRKALGLKAQNYLIKPYNEALIYAEIAKSTANPWRNLHFEEVKSFCAQLGLSPVGLAKMRRDLMTRLDENAEIFPGWTTNRENATVFEQIDAISADAEAAGVWGVVEYMRELRTHAEAANWSAFKTSADSLTYASRLIFCQLNPSYVPDCLRSDEALARQKEAADRARWLGTDVDSHGPVVTKAELEKQLAALPGCPVIDTVAAAFQMAADKKATSLDAVMERSANDPGLCAQVLAAANHGDDAEATLTDDPRAAVSRLGVLKLNNLGKAFPLIPERHMHVAPLTWADFWMFQVSVAKLAQFICDYLELSYLRANAYTAGVMHDIGMLLLVRLYPFALEPMMQYAQAHKKSLRETERKFLGMTTREMAAYFADTSGLPPVYRNVIRWVDTPELATENTEIVAIVALARHLCLHNRVGCCGDVPVAPLPPITKTAAWQVLQPQLFPSFDVGKFEAQAHACCVELRDELVGHRR